MRAALISIVPKNYVKLEPKTYIFKQIDMIFSTKLAQKGSCGSYLRAALIVLHLLRSAALNRGRLLFEGGS